MNPIQTALNIKTGAEKKLQGFGRKIGNVVRSGVKSYDQAGQNLIKQSKQNGVKLD